MTRDEKGRFSKGQSGNPNGRKPRSVEQSYLDAMIGEVSLVEWRQIVAKAKSQAIHGDQTARKWLGDYLQGTPVTKVDQNNSGELIVRIIDDDRIGLEATNDDE